MQTKIVKLLANAALVRSHMTDHVWWEKYWRNRVNACMAHAPSGSGIGNGITVDWDASTGDALVITIPYHHMDDVGGYCGWITYTAVVRSSLLFDLDISFRPADTTEYDGSRRDYDVLPEDTTDEEVQWEDGVPYRAYDDTEDTAALTEVLLDDMLMAWLLMEIEV